MTAFDKGFNDGMNNARNDRIRTYQTDKSENAYWHGYIKGMIQSNPNKQIVQCNREGKIFAVTNIADCVCPVCKRRYINGESDRPLKVIQ